MAKYIGIEEGKRQEIEAITVSSGVASAFKIPSLGPTGQFSPTMIPPSLEDGSASSPFRSLNVKKVEDGKYHIIGNNLESVVTKYQVIDGILTVDGVNTIL